MVRNTQVATPGALSYRGEMIRRDTDGMVNLTDMWRAAGSPEKSVPGLWARLDATRDLIDVLAVNMRPAHILRATKGCTGSTWACPNLAVAYAKYLSPEFYAWANNVAWERLEEEQDPELGIERSRERAIKAWRRKGRSGAWIQRRLEGIDARNYFTDTLQEHGVTDSGYAHCTNAIYRPLLGGSASEVKRIRELPVKANLRDFLKASELMAVGLSETLASETIDKHNLNGQVPCHDACKWSASNVADALESNERPPPFLRNRAS